MVGGVIGQEPFSSISFSTVSRKVQNSWETPLRKMVGRAFMANLF